MHPKQHYPIYPVNDKKKKPQSPSKFGIVKIEQTLTFQGDNDSARFCPLE